MANDTVTVRWGSAPVLLVLSVLILLELRNELRWLNVESTGTVKKSIDNAKDTDGIDQRSIAVNSSQQPRYAVATFIDRHGDMYGLYSIRNQLRKLSPHIPLIVVAGTNVAEERPDMWTAVHDWVGAEHTRVVNKSYIFENLHDKLWAGTFNKLWLFNLTDFDKVIVLDCDVLVRKDISHWFVDYPTPSATQPGDNIEWNSGAMVISPNQTLFEDMVATLPLVYPYNNENASESDNMNSAFHDQGFFSAYFTHPDKVSRFNHNQYFGAMPTQASVLSSSIRRPNLGYWVKHRWDGPYRPSHTLSSSTRMECVCTGH